MQTLVRRSPLCQTVCYTYVCTCMHRKHNHMCRHVHEHERSALHHLVKLLIRAQIEPQLPRSRIYWTAWLDTSPHTHTPVTIYYIYSCLCKWHYPTRMLWVGIYIHVIPDSRVIFGCYAIAIPTFHCMYVIHGKYCVPWTFLSVLMGSWNMTIHRIQWFPQWWSDHISSSLSSCAFLHQPC